MRRGWQGRPEARHGSAVRPDSPRGPRPEGAATAAAAGEYAKTAGGRRGRESGSRRGPLVLLDGDAAVQLAIGRRYSHSYDRHLPDRFDAYVDANAGGVALTAGARDRAVRSIQGLGGPRTKKRTVLTEEIGAMESADASGHEAWLGRMDAMHRAAAGDPLSRAAKRWMRLKKDLLSMTVRERGPGGEAAASMLAWLYDHAASARLAAAEAARAAETGGGRGRGREGAHLVTMDLDILAFAGEIGAMTGGRLRVLDADRVGPSPTKRERAERAARLRRLVPRAGQSISEGELKGRLGTGRLGRITRVKGAKVVVIVRDLGDTLTLVRNGFVLCVGDGGTDQRMVRNNRAVLDSGPDGYDILLFERTGRGGGDRLAFVSRLEYVSHRARWINDEYGAPRGRLIVFKLGMKGSPE